VNVRVGAGEPVGAGVRVDVAVRVGAGVRVGAHVAVGAVVGATGCAPQADSSRHTAMAVMARLFMKRFLLELG
jgi:hypothetical protein